MRLTVSTLPQMWIIDVDGTIFIHNSYLEGEDQLVPNFLDFYTQIKSEDFILLVSARDQKYEKKTINSLHKHGIRYDKIIFNAPKGERILINDTKPGGLKTAIAINNKRDQFTKIHLKFDENM